MLRASPEVAGLGQRVALVVVGDENVPPGVIIGAWQVEVVEIGVVVWLVKWTRGIDRRINSVRVAIAADFGWLRFVRSHVGTMVTNKRAATEMRASRIKLALLCRNLAEGAAKYYTDVHYFCRFFAASL
jgi:hypothetical protein